MKKIKIVSIVLFIILLSLIKVDYSLIVPGNVYNVAFDKSKKLYLVTVGVTSQDTYINTPTLLYFLTQIDKLEILNKRIIYSSTASDEKGMYYDSLYNSKKIAYSYLHFPYIDLIRVTSVHKYIFDSSLDIDKIVTIDDIHFHNTNSIDNYLNKKINNNNKYDPKVCYFPKESNKLKCSKGVVQYYESELNSNDLIKSIDGIDVNNLYGNSNIHSNISELSIIRDGVNMTLTVPSIPFFKGNICDQLYIGCVKDIYSYDDRNGLYDLNNNIEGPSGGIALLVSILSKYNFVHLPKDPIAITGALTDDGKVQPIGGVNIKSVTVSNHHIEKFYIPSENCKDIADGYSISNRLKIIPYSSIDELIDELNNNRSNRCK